MSYGLIDHETLENIASAIRIKANSESQYYPRNMANAILQIVTSGEGFNEPICFDYKTYLPTLKSFPPFSNTDNMKGLEIITQSELDSVEDPENYHEVFKGIEWSSMSPGKMDLYHYSNASTLGANKYKYYIVIPTGSEKKVSFLNMSEMFKYSNGLTTAYSGNYTNNMYYAYYSCSGITTAECGPKVEDLSYAYAFCSNLVTAKCGDAVKNMDRAYYASSNLTTAAIGANVEKLDYAYCSDYQITNDLVIPEKVNSMIYAFSGCVFVTGIAVLGDKIPDDSNKIAMAFSGRSAQSGPYEKRNVVVQYKSTYDILVKPSNSVFGNNIEFTEEEYEEPVKITVNNVEYNTFRCSYNTDINTYVYCVT